MNTYDTGQTGNRARSAGLTRFDFGRKDSGLFRRREFFSHALLMQESDIASLFPCAGMRLFLSDTAVERLPLSLRRFSGLRSIVIINALRALLGPGTESFGIRPDTGQAENRRRVRFSRTGTDRIICCIRGQVFRFESSVSGCTAGGFLLPNPPSHVKRQGKRDRHFAPDRSVSGTCAVLLPESHRARRRSQGRFCQPRIVFGYYLGDQSGSKPQGSKRKASSGGSITALNDVIREREASSDAPARPFFIPDLCCRFAACHILFLNHADHVLLNFHACDPGNSDSRLCSSFGSILFRPQTYACPEIPQGTEERETTKSPARQEALEKELCLDGIKRSREEALCSSLRQDNERHRFFPGSKKIETFIARRFTAAYCDVGSIVSGFSAGSLMPAGTDHVYGFCVRRSVFRFGRSFSGLVAGGLLLTPNAMSNTEMLKVYSIVDRGEDKKSLWLQIGVAFVNKDGSLNIRLNALPIDGNLHIRKEDHDA